LELSYLRHFIEKKMAAARQNHPNTPYKFARHSTAKPQTRNANVVFDLKSAAYCHIYEHMFELFQLRNNSHW